MLVQIKNCRVQRSKPTIEVAFDCLYEAGSAAAYLGSEYFISPIGTFINGMYNVGITRFVTSLFSTAPFIYGAIHYGKQAYSAYNNAKYFWAGETTKQNESFASYQTNRNKAILLLVIGMLNLSIYALSAINMGC